LLIVAKAGLRRPCLDRFAVFDRAPRKPDDRVSACLRVGDLKAAKRRQIERATDCSQKPPPQSQKKPGSARYRVS